MSIIKEYKIQEKFYSKKNDVYKIRCTFNDNTEKTCVLKIYKNNSMDKETYMLSMLKEKKVNVPEIFHIGKKEIIMEYIEGKNLLDVITELELSSDEYIDKKTDDIIYGLCNWLDSFYKSSYRIFGRSIIFVDVNLRNFILSDKMYGVDFEDCKEGHKETDAGRICAFILTYTPMFTDWKKEFVRKSIHVMTEEFGYNKDLVFQEMNIELEEISKRRGIDIGQGVFS